MKFCLQIYCALPKQGRDYAINEQKSLNLASAIRTLQLTEKEDEEVGDGEREQVVVGGGAHPGEAQDHAAHGQVAEYARDGHHCSTSFPRSERQDSPGQPRKLMRTNKKNHPFLDISLSFSSKIYFA